MFDLRLFLLPTLLPTYPHNHPVFKREEGCQEMTGNKAATPDSMQRVDGVRGFYFLEFELVALPDVRHKT